MNSILQRLDPGDGTFQMGAVLLCGVTLLSAAAWLIACAMPHRPALRHAVLWSALLGCCALPALAGLSAAMGCTLVSIPLLPREEPVPPQEITAASDRFTSISECLSVPAPKSADFSHDRPTTDQPLADVCCPKTESGFRSVDPEDRTSAAAEPTSSGSIDTPAVGRLPPEPVTHRGWRVWAVCGFAVWAVGVAVMLARLGRSCFAVVRLRRSARPVSDPAVLSVLNDAVRRLASRRLPQVLVSDSAPAPLAVGFGPPAVILPERLLSAIGVDELSDILIHEAAHLQRGDQNAVVLQELVAALYWPIVSVHLLARGLQRAREDLCDNAVLAGRDAVGYGRTLLHVAELLLPARPIQAAAGMLPWQGQLERRIAALVDPARSRSTRAGRATVATIFAASFVFTMFAAAARLVSVDSVMAEPPSFAGISDQQPGASAQPGPEASAVASEKRQFDEPIDSPDQGLPTIDWDRLVLVEGRIADAENRPVAGASLHLSADSWTDPLPLGQSDAGGAFRFRIPEKSFRRYMDNTPTPQVRAALVVYAQGFAGAWELLTPDHRGTWDVMQPRYALDIRLEADFPIAGQIVDAAGHPLAGVEVALGAIEPLDDPNCEPLRTALESRRAEALTREQLDPASWKSKLFKSAWDFREPAVTDLEGRFRLDGIGRNRAVRLTIAGAGVRSMSVGILTHDDAREFTRALRTRFPRDAGQGGAADLAGVQVFAPSATIPVQSARTLAGTVRDARTGTQISDVRIVVSSGHSAGRSAYTDRRGRYRIVCSDNGSIFWVQASPRDNVHYLSATRVVDGARDLETVADFDLSPGVAVAGRIVEAGTDRPVVSGPRHTCHAPWPGVVVAGLLYYYPLATNTALRETPTGAYFGAEPQGNNNYYSSVWVGADGKFRMAVPTGPGVLLFRSAPGMPDFATFGTWDESAGYHRRFPYVPLSARSTNDGAPGRDPQSFPGFTAPIPLDDFHAYQVIDPTEGTTTLDLTIEVARAPSRKVRFIDSEGRAIRGLRVEGILGPPHRMTVRFPGSEVESLALTAGESRRLFVTSLDGKFAGIVPVSADDPHPLVATLEPAVSLMGRLLDEATGQPLPNVFVQLILKHKDAAGDEQHFGGNAETDAQGQFRFQTVVPGSLASLTFSEQRLLRQYRPAAAQRIEIKSGEAVDLGEVRVPSSTP